METTRNRSLINTIAAWGSLSDPQTCEQMTSRLGKRNYGIQVRESGTRFFRSSEDAAQYKPVRGRHGRASLVAHLPFWYGSLDFCLPIEIPGPVVLDVKFPLLFPEMGFPLLADASRLMLVSLESHLVVH